VLAWKNALMSGDEPKPQEQDPGHARLRSGSACGRFSSLPIPENQQKMIRALHTYRKHVPDAPEVPVMLYREAYIYYDHNQFDRAEPLFLDVVQKYPKHDLAVYSANLYLDALNMECKSKEVLATARKFLDTPELVSHDGFAEPIVAIVSDGYELEARASRSRATARNAAVRSGRGGGVALARQTCRASSGTRASASRTRTWWASRSRPGVR
jgi:hypothetical protein